MRPILRSLVAALSPIATAQRTPLFKEEILPILEKRCTKCHSPQQKIAGLDLTTFTGLMTGGGSGPVIAPGRRERSLLWKMVESEKMPMGGKLSALDKQALKAYIEFGRFPKQDLAAAELSHEAAVITDASRRWWSFRKPVKPALPAIRNAAQTRNPIDTFILAELEKKGRSLQPEAQAKAQVKARNHHLRFGL